MEAYELDFGSVFLTRVSGHDLYIHCPTMVTVSQLHIIHFPEHRAFSLAVYYCLMPQ